MDDYDATDDFAKSLDVGYQAIRARVAAGGPGWTPKDPQGDLFSTPAPYRGDPPAQRHSETSKAAAESIRKAVGPLHRKILTHLAERSHRDLDGQIRLGSTDEEMQVEIPMNPNTQRPRRRELQLMGKIRNSGRERLAQSGQLAVVWELVP